VSTWRGSAVGRLGVCLSRRMSPRSSSEPWALRLVLLLLVLLLLLLVLPLLQLLPPMIVRGQDL